MYVHVHTFVYVFLQASDGIGGLDIRTYCVWGEGEDPGCTVHVYIHTYVCNKHLNVCVLFPHFTRLAWLHCDHCNRMSISSSL